MKNQIAASLLAACVAITGCARVDETVRTERGPLLRTFERPLVITGGVRGTVTAKWPALTVQLQGFDTCRTEVIDEYAEDKIRERGSGGMGAALSSGVFLTAVGIGLLAAQGLFSNEPNRTVIDASGRYGASSRQLERNWSIVFLALGVPSMAVGAYGIARSGTETTTVKVEQISNQRDEDCHLRAVDGPLQLVSPRGAFLTQATESGAMTVSAADLKGNQIDRLVFYERDVALDQASAEVLAGFSACVQLEQQPLTTPDLLSIGSLLQKLERAQACRVVRPDEMKGLLDPLENELTRRREGGEQGAFLPGSRKLGSFEEAISAYPPRFQLTAASPDIARLDDAESLAGATVLISGRVLEGVSPNIGVVQVADRQVFVFLPHDAPWGGDFGNGVDVDVLGVVAGSQTVGNRTATLVKAVWMRRAQESRTDSRRMP